MSLSLPDHKVLHITVSMVEEAEGHSDERPPSTGLNLRKLQMLKANGILQGTLRYITQGYQEYLNWWIDSLSEWNRRAILSPVPDLVITMDLSLKRRGAVCDIVHPGVFEQA